MEKKENAFSVVEVLVALAILALLAATVPLTMNFKKQLDRSNDIKRKSELITLQKSFEEFYAGERGYPSAAEICFNMPSSARYVDSLGLNMGCVCNICGKKLVGNSTQGEKLGEYIKDIPCDPASSALISQTNQDYIYNFDCAPGAVRPQWFRIYSKLSIGTDPATRELGCENGCGPKFILSGTDKVPNENSAQITNNFAVTSPNIEVEK